MDDEKKIFVLDIGVVDSVACKAEYSDMNKLMLALERANIQLTNWEESASQQARNTEFYRSIIVQIGNMFGDAAKIADDGSVMGDVLALKVPELVAKLIKGNNEIHTN